MNQNANFLAFRYFLVPVSEQMTINQLTVEEKGLMMKQIFTILEQSNKLSHKIRERKYILYLKEKITEEIYLCKFAKEIFRTKYNEGEHDIESTQEQEFPYVYAIINLRRQIILIQSKSAVFRELSTVKNIVEDWFYNEIGWRFDYIFKLDEITNEHIFWDYIQESESIFEVDLRMKSPNLFGGRLEVSSLLKQINFTFNNTESTLKLKNEQGKLKIDKENLDDAVKYITGGWWRMEN